MLKKVLKSDKISKRSEFRSFSFDFPIPELVLEDFYINFSFSVDEIRSCVECSYK